MAIKLTILTYTEGLNRNSTGEVSLTGKISNEVKETRELNEYQAIDQQIKAIAEEIGNFNELAWQDAEEDKAYRITLKKLVE